jgi:hypothetical protein
MGGLGHSDSNGNSPSPCGAALSESPFGDYFAIPPPARVKQNATVSMGLFLWSSGNLRSSTAERFGGYPEMLGASLGLRLTCRLHILGSSALLGRCYVEPAREAISHGRCPIALLPSRSDTGACTSVEDTAPSNAVRCNLILLLLCSGLAALGRSTVSPDRLFFPPLLSVLLRPIM